VKGLKNCANCQVPPSQNFWVRHCFPDPNIQKLYIQLNWLFYSEECLVIMIGKKFFGHGIHIYLSCYNMIYLCNLWDFESHEDVHIFFAYFFIISNDFQNLHLGLHKSKSSFKNNIFGVTYLVWLYLLASLFSRIE